MIVTVTDAVSEHPLASVTVTTYVVVAPGVAEGLETVVLLNPLAGDQEKPVPPLALSVVELPLHMATPDPAVAVGNGLTVIVTLAVLEQFPLETVTVYVVVVVGEALGLETVMLLNPVAGDQE